MKKISIGSKLIVLFIITMAFVVWGYCQEVQNVPVRPVKVAGGVYWLGDFECNIAASVGTDGVLIVDSGDESVTDKVRSALMQISKEPVRIIMNTHFHFDHVGGNEAFARDGALIISQDKARERMTMEWKPREILGVQWPNLPSYSTPALAKVCYAESLTVYFNGEEIEAIHLPAAHSDGDVVIRFKRANVVHTGDLCLSNGFSVIDLSSHLKTLL
jgi:cyclase